MSENQSSNGVALGDTAAAVNKVADAAPAFDAAVRADLRGRYPKHAWPEDPVTAPPSKGPARRPR